MEEGLRRRGRRTRRKRGYYVLHDICILVSLSNCFIPMTPVIKK
jgi:hypothetical protein